MKDLLKKIPWRRMWMIPLLLSALLINGKIAIAQLPDCSAGISMYGLFTNVAGSGTADSTEIRSINYSTGAVGPLMGGKRYWIRKLYATGPDRYYYSSSALGVDLITNRFYLFTQMGNALRKDLITIDPVTATETIIGTTPTSPVSLSNYHIVKTAIHPTGSYGYAIGVHRDSTSSAATYNPLIRFTTCGGSPVAGCSSIELLGYLPSSGLMYKQLLFNGDIAFDVSGNLYFATAAFQAVGTIMRYTDARLFRINSTDIPAAAGTGSIPMTLLAEYNGLDSTVINGIALSPSGTMYFSTRRFLAEQTSPAGPSVTEVYSSFSPGNANIISGFSSPTPNFVLSDLASCHFPMTILANNKIQLSGKHEFGKSHLNWEVNNNMEVNYFEIQKSGDGINFELVAAINPDNILRSAVNYQYKDTQNVLGKTVFYRIRQIMKNGMRFYSNIAQVYSNSIMNIIGSMSPNPFIDHVNFVVQLKIAKTVEVRLADQNGRIVYYNQFKGRTGENKFKLNDIGALKKGIYFIEICVENDVHREKLLRL